IQTGAGFIRTAFRRTLVGTAAEIPPPRAVGSNAPTAGLLHDRPTAPADHQSGQRVDLAARSTTTAALQHLLACLNGLPADERSMGGRHYGPLGCRQPVCPFGFVANLFMTALDQVSRIGAVAQHLVYRRRPPEGRFRPLHSGLVGNTVLLFVG